MKNKKDMQIHKFVLLIDFTACANIIDYLLTFNELNIRLKIKPNSVRIRFLSCQIVVLPSTGFDLTPLKHCSTIRLALRPAP
jgi:hypothetical protein